MSNKYAFYDIGKVCTRGLVDHARSPSSSPMALKNLAAKAQPTAQKPAKTYAQTPKMTFDDIFSGPSATATRSSRRDLSHRAHSKTIAGVRVPSRPREPGDKDCCMSGCVNCVWELFNADLDDWKYKRSLAVKALKSNSNKSGEKWPADWEAPPKDLPSEFLPAGVEVKSVQEEAAMPVGMAVFTNFEKKLRQQRNALEQQ